MIEEIVGIRRRWKELKEVGIVHSGGAVYVDNQWYADSPRYWYSKPVIKIQAGEE